MYLRFPFVIPDSISLAHSPTSQLIVFSRPDSDGNKMGNGKHIVRILIPIGAGSRQRKTPMKRLRNNSMLIFSNLMLYNLRLEQGSYNHL